MERPRSTQGGDFARTSWERFAASGKIGDYMEYKKTANSESSVNRQ